MSKLADLMFGLEPQNLLTMVDSPIASICAHPGYSITNIKNSTPLYIRFLDALPQPFLAQSAAQGALSTLFAAAAPTAQSGGFYGPDGFLETKGYPAPAKIPARAQDRTVRRRPMMTRTRELVLPSALNQPLPRNDYSSRQNIYPAISGMSAGPMCLVL